MIEMTFQDIIHWIQGNIWLCTIITTVLAILTFVLNFIIKKNREQTNTQTISNVTSSLINQAGGDINHNKDAK